MQLWTAAVMREQISLYSWSTADYTGFRPPQTSSLFKSFVLTELRSNLETDGVRSLSVGFCV